MPLSNAVRNFARFVTQSGSLTILTPTEGQALTNPAVSVTWGAVGGAQTSYRVRVYSDSGLTTLVYDSGVVVSATASATIPAGALSTGATYYLRLDVFFSDGSSVQSSTRSFSTNFPAGGSVTLRVTPIGGCRGDPTALPGLRLSWTITLGAGEAYVSTVVQRRVGGTSQWTTLATYTVQSTAAYTDYLVRSGEVYQYRVLYNATIGATPVQSADNTKTSSVSFDFHFIHAIGAESTFARLDGYQQDIDLSPDVSLVPVWGRQAPVAQIGDAQANRIRMRCAPELYSSRRRTDSLIDLIASQRTTGRTLCLRLGRPEELYYGVLLPLKRSNDQKTTSVSVDFAEVGYTVGS